MSESLHGLRRPDRAISSLPAMPDTDPHQACIEQLTHGGVVDFFRHAGAEKVALFAAQEVAAPRPLAGCFGCDDAFVREHDTLEGTIPASGLFFVEEGFVGEGGTMVGADRKVLYDADLVSAEWMSF